MALPAALALPLLSSLFGGKQLGAAAPVFQPGQAPGLLGADQPDLSQLAALGNFGNPLEEAMSGITTGSPIIPGDSPPLDPTFGGALGSFASGIDSTLSSPSQALGIGLLGRIDPRLAGGGLLASGLLGKSQGSDQNSFQELMARLGLG